MSKKVFISYSHKDEAYKDSLEEHLSLLKNNNIISVWHDRKISAGDDWKEQLDENLESADIVIFLVSSSFLASKYCTDIEVRKAIKKHEEGLAIIFSIIVRPCDWEGGNFSRFQSLPKNLKPISTWKNKDSGWVDAINGLKESIQKYNFPSAVISEPSKKNFKLTDEQLKWLVDTDVDFSTRKYGKINLDDIYVPLIFILKMKQIKKVMILSV
ncbi:toll/interleukin-1 receptor domain-containing protein [Thiothrix subterranea]|uniref:toll/interleukin-1 receptor domain-containing protein n=1 Tax=Thiothrix subterranea TaxID=2735563 RepID=UPI00280B1F4E|nr:toll/interleukin-1 receptor domain-containing protein [Thiothrix subterranea]